MQRQRDEGGLERCVGEDRGKRVEQAFVDRAASCPARSAPTLSTSSARGERLHRLPAVERIAVVRGEEAQVVGGEIGDELDRRREAAVEREHRALGDAA